MLAVINYNKKIDTEFSEKSFLNNKQFYNQKKKIIWQQDIISALKINNNIEDNENVESKEEFKNFYFDEIPEDADLDQYFSNFFNNNIV